MGAAITKQDDFSKNQFLMKFVSEEHISVNDPFWNTFLSFNIQIPTKKDDQLAFEACIEPICQQLLKNNLKTGNIATIIQVFINKSTELLSATNCDAALFNWQVYNNLFVIRSILKFLSEILSEEDFTKHIEFNIAESNLEAFVGALIGTLVDVPVKDLTYAIHQEIITTLLVLLSMPYHFGRRSEQSTIFRLIMKGKHAIHAPFLVRNLLNNFINQEKAPHPFGLNSSHSFVVGIASELWSLITFNRKTEQTEMSQNEELQEVPLATNSLLLILVLAHHWTAYTNPYRSSLFYCVNSEDGGPLPPTTTDTLFKINFSSLYTVLCKKSSIDSATLLLYLLLHRNPAFKKYVLDRTDIDLLVIPVLKTLYNAPNSNSHHIYMSLIILLILSEDDTFNQSIHQTKLKSIPWYTERALTEISLGGLLILITIRTVQYNMLKMRDKYLHTNCLAALANMSSKFRDLHPYVSQRLVSLFETLAKKYHRLVQSLRSNSKEVAIELSKDDSDQDLGVLEEVLRMVLEILNSCLSKQLNDNPNLVYTLLYNKDIFESFRNNVVFQDIIHNIDIIIRYFSNLLSEKSQQHEVDASQVLIVIQQGAKHWPKDKLTKFPELKFKYVEEEQPEEFFIPYVWTLVTQQTVLHLTNDSSHVLTAVC